MRFVLVVESLCFCLLLPRSLCSRSDEAGSGNYCALPEVVDAGSTGSITHYQADILQQSDEICNNPEYQQYRTADGTCNNMFNLGSAGRPVRRLLKSAYQDGRNAFRSRSSSNSSLPPATDVSRIMHPSRDIHKGFTVMLMQWGQFVDHDLAGFPIVSEANRSIKCCGENGKILPYKKHSNCNPIHLSAEDRDKRFVGECMEFLRSVAASNAHGNEIIPREQLNMVTSFLDASNVYGSSREVQKELREKGSRSYLMRTSPGDLLPPNNNEGSCIPRPGEFCFLAGDKRVNEHPGLAAIHTVFVRLHNILARDLHRSMFSSTSEVVFQTTRKIVGAIMQNIHYGEWLPIILGRRLMQRYDLDTGNRSEFVPYMDPTISNEFATAAFRFGHSLIPSRLNFSGRFMPLRELFGHVDEIFDNFDVVVNSLVHPLETSGSLMMDRFFSTDITGHLFEPQEHSDNVKKPSRGLDLVALNIQRGRDHGLRPYNKYREFCGLPVLHSFGDLPKDVAQGMKKLYESVEDVDLFSGLMTEKPARRQMVGPTLGCLLGKEFQSLKYGDRFYFESDCDAGFPDVQLKAIRNITLARVLCLVTDLDSVQKNVFRIPHSQNEMLNCSGVRENFLDLSLW